MKKLLAMLLAIALVVGAVGCSNTTNDSSKAQDSSKAEESSQADASQEESKEEEVTGFTYPVAPNPDGISGYDFHEQGCICT